MGQWVTEVCFFFTSPFSLCSSVQWSFQFATEFFISQNEFFSSRFSIWFLLRFPLLLRLPIWAWIMSFFSYKTLNIFTRKNLKYLSTNSTYLSSLGLFLLLFFPSTSEIAFFPSCFFEGLATLYIARYCGYDVAECLEFLQNVVCSGMKLIYWQLNLIKISIRHCENGSRTALTFWVQYP